LRLYTPATGIYRGLGVSAGIGTILAVFQDGKILSFSFNTWSPAHILRRAVFLPPCWGVCAQRQGSFSPAQQFVHQTEQFGTILAGIIPWKVISLSPSIPFVLTASRGEPFFCLSL
jgi:hypothetical protein